MQNPYNMWSEPDIGSFDPTYHILGQYQARQAMEQAQARRQLERDILGSADSYAYAPDQSIAELLPAINKAFLNQAGGRGRRKRRYGHRYPYRYGYGHRYPYRYGYGHRYPYWHGYGTPLPANRTMTLQESNRRTQGATEWQQQDAAQDRLVRQIFEQVTGLSWPW